MRGKERERTLINSTRNTMNGSEEIDRSIDESVFTVFHLQPCEKRGRKRPKEEEEEREDGVGPTQRTRDTGERTEVCLHSAHSLKLTGPRHGSLRRSTSLSLLSLLCNPPMLQPGAAPQQEAQQTRLLLSLVLRNTRQSTGCFLFFFFWPLKWVSVSGTRPNFRQTFGALLLKERHSRMTERKAVCVE